MKESSSIEKVWIRLWPLDESRESFSGRNSIKDLLFLLEIAKFKADSSGNLMVYMFKNSKGWYDLHIGCTYKKNLETEMEAMYDENT